MSTNVNYCLARCRLVLTNVDSMPARCRLMSAGLAAFVLIVRADDIPAKIGAHCLWVGGGTSKRWKLLRILHRGVVVVCSGRASQPGMLPAEHPSLARSNMVGLFAPAHASHASSPAAIPCRMRRVSFDLRNQAAQGPLGIGLGNRPARLHGAVSIACIFDTSAQRLALPCLTPDLLLLAGSVAGVSITALSAGAFLYIGLVEALRPHRIVACA